MKKTTCQQRTDCQSAPMGIEYHVVLVNIETPILKINFLAHFGLLPDLIQTQLIVEITACTMSGALKEAPANSISASKPQQNSTTKGKHRSLLERTSIYTSYCNNRPPFSLKLAKNSKQPKSIFVKCQIKATFAHPLNQPTTHS